MHFFYLTWQTLYLKYKNLIFENMRFEVRVLEDCSSFSDMIFMLILVFVDLGALSWILLFFLQIGFPAYKLHVYVE